MRQCNYIWPNGWPGFTVRPDICERLYPKKTKAVDIFSCPWLRVEREKERLRQRERLTEWETVYVKQKFSSVNTANKQTSIFSSYGVQLEKNTFVHNLHLLGAVNLLLPDHSSHLGLRQLVLLVGLCAELPARAYRPQRAEPSVSPPEPLLPPPEPPSSPGVEPGPVGRALCHGLVLQPVGRALRRDGAGLDMSKFFYSKIPPKKPKMLSAVILKRAFGVKLSYNQMIINTLVSCRTRLICSVV